MRLTSEQIAQILSLSRQIVGGDVSVSVFGSRLDDGRRGGDLDLLIEADHRPTLLQRAELKSRLEAEMQMPVDIVGRQRGGDPRAFEAIAMARGVRLE